MRVLITGHNGYVGTVLTPRVVDAGHEVIGVDTNLYKGSTFGQGLVQLTLRELETDIRDLTPDHLAGVDAILHLAALSNDPLGDLNPTLTYEINYHASVGLAELAKQAGVSRFVFASSCSNYGAGGDHWLTEKSAFNPVTPYGRSKVLAEQAISQLADDTFTPVFLRSATAYGVSARLRFDLVVNNLVAWAYTTGRVYLKSAGTSWRPFVHIEDMARAFVAVLHAPRAAVHNQAFNVGQTDENYSIRQIAEIIVEMVPGSHIDFAPDAEPDTRNYKVNMDKIAHDLPSFQPQWTVSRGVEELLNAYKQSAITVDEFEGPHYRRVSHIKALLAEGQLDDTLRWRKLVYA